MKIYFGLFIILAVSAVTSCGPNQRILESQENRATTPEAAGGSSAPTVRGFEQDITAMRNADFNFIYVFRRRDGGPLDGDDKAFISKTTPPEMNRKTLSDEGKAVIIGSNFKMSDEMLDTFKSRFVFEDFSKADLPSETPGQNRGS